MDAKAQPDSSELRKAFLEYERVVRIRNYQVGCILAFIFMPAGATLDWFVYQPYFKRFLALRLLCSFLLGVVWALLQFVPGRKLYRVLGLSVALLPMFFISWMIYATQGAASPYYAGLNLVMLGAAILLRWTLLDSIVVFILLLLTYLGACLLHGPIPAGGTFFNNFYFLFVTGVFIITGSWFYNQIRLREFALRFELDKNRAMLEESNEKLKELDQVKNRFFANISHELRTPLTLLLSPLETVMHGRGNQFDPETRNLLSIMHGNGMRLLKLINDLLDLVRLESGRMEVKREPLEMTAFVQGLAAAPRQMADNKGLKLETYVQPDLGPVMADRDKLEKMVLNLVFNALKFTPAGGRVTLRVERSAENLVIAVEDTGVGISAKNLPYVFDRFWQADNSSKRKYQGVGIGLSLVKELTEIQGGNVAVTSLENVGTTFTVSLPFLAAQKGAAKPEDALAAPADTTPVAEPQGSTRAQSEEWLGNLYRRAALLPGAAITPDQEPAVETAKNNGGQSTLLVADDEPDMLRFLKSQLVSHYRVIVAVDGAQAINKARENLPDIILLDMNMPEKDGLQVCRELRQHPPTREIPVIILTARADEETKLAALTAGANDFLAKPFSTSELHVRVKNLVESHHFQEKLAKQNQVLETTIEQLKETETMLVQTEKMVSLGRMSAGIIHEINNPLNYATTGLYTLRGKGKKLVPEEQAEYEEVLREVEDGINRVKSIVSDLRTFTHPNADQVEPLKIAPLADSALKFLSSEWKEKVRVDLQISDDVIVHANRNKLVQVMVNLLQNSLDAIRHKKFAAGEEPPAISITARRDGNKNVILLRDNGEGIEPEALNKIFDPFFTTKDVGEGMGLGLTICYRIMQEYGGRVTVRSERGKYCEFKLEFPVKE